MGRRGPLAANRRGCFRFADVSDGPPDSDELTGHLIWAVCSGDEQVHFVNVVVKDAQHELAAIIANIDYREEELNENKNEANLAAAQAEEVFCDHYSETESKLKNVAERMAPSFRFRNILFLWFIRGNKMSYNLRERLSKQLKRKMSYNLRPRESNKPQGSKRIINDASEEQSIQQELLESSDHLGNNIILKNFHKKPRTERFLIARLFAHSQESTPTASLNSISDSSSDQETDEELVTENLSSNEEYVYDQAPENPSYDEEYVPEHPELYKLKPPSVSDGFRTGKEHLEVLKLGSFLLISDIKKTTDAHKMIDLSSKAFTYFDSIGVDYMPVYKAVCSVIHHHYDKEALSKQKPHHAFDTKASHDQAASELSKTEERYTGVNRKLEDAQHDFDAVTAHLNHLYAEIKKADEEKAKLQAKVAAAQADKVTFDEAYSKAKSKLEKIAPKMSEAQKAIDEYEKRWKESMDALNRSMEELSSLQNLL